MTERMVRRGTQGGSRGLLDCWSVSETRTCGKCVYKNLTLFCLRAQHALRNARVNEAVVGQVSRRVFCERLYWYLFISILCH